MFYKSASAGTLLGESGLIRRREDEFLLHHQLSVSLVPSALALSHDLLVDTMYTTARRNLIFAVTVAVRILLLFRRRRPRARHVFLVVRGRRRAHAVGQLGIVEIGLAVDLANQLAHRAMRRTIFR